MEIGTECLHSNWYLIPCFCMVSPVFSGNRQLNGSVKEPNMFHNYKTEKITHKASDVAENLQLYRVVRFFCPRSSCTTTHLMLFSERPLIYASCMTISGGRTEQLDIIALQVFCHVTGFTSDFHPPKTSADICVVHDDLGWKNQTTRCNRFWRAGCSRLEYVDICSVYYPKN